MNRPYTVCYMMTSVDGRIDCAMTAQIAGVEDYYPLLDKLDLRSAVSGKTTARLELAEQGEFKPADSTPAGKKTVSKKADSTEGYDIITDTKGTLLWKDDKEYDKPHIILTSEQVSREYLNYLDGKHISYIATGADIIDLTDASVTLKETFGIERLGIVGGAAINTAYLDAGLLDEVIVLIGAAIDGRGDYPPVFNREKGGSLVRLKLMETKAFDSGAVMIRYTVKK